MPPRERQKLQPRNPDVLGNVSDRYYRAGNVEGMKRIGQELQDRMQNHPSLRPGTGGIFNTSPMEGGSIDPRSFWNVGLQSGDNTGIMSAAMTDHSPDAKGRWLTESPTGNKFFSYMVNKAQEAGFTSPESVDYLQNAIGGGGIPLWGGYVRPTWGDGSYGIEGNWKFGG